MAKAYASLVSIMQLLDDLQNHPRPPISLHKHQAQSLTQILTFFQEFLEVYHYHVGYTKQIDAIADAAHAVEDVIESHIVDQILADGERISSSEFYEALQKVINDMELVKKEIMVMRVKMEVESSTSTAASTYVASSNSASVGQEQDQTMVGFDEILLEILDKVTSHKSSRQIISITGMGGIGKTTLARNVYQHDFVVQHFDFLAWVTISQEYNHRKTLEKVLEGKVENLSQLDENDLGLKLHQMLSGRRYLIIIDDIWNIDVWDRLNLFMPDNNNGSRIMITTRLSDLARQMEDSHNIVMGFMDEGNSWNLFCKHVFGNENCPPELEDLGRNIVRGCKGLPLSISVVGGLLAKSDRTQQHWEHIAENLNSIVNLENKEHCLQILYMSYTSLPIHLKSCFLSLGYFDEDDDIPFLFVIQMWVGDGIVRPVYGKSLEEAAKEYLTELIDRNLLLIEDDMAELDHYWMLKSFKIHDLLRDLCLRECEKQKFLMVVRDWSSRISHNIRRIRVPKSTREEEVLPIMKSNSLVRSLILEPIIKSLVSLKLLRVALLQGIYNLEDIILLVNLRVIIIHFFEVEQSRIPSSISRFWNLQTLVASDCSSINELDIWNMPQLRMIFVERLRLSDPPSGEEDMSDGFTCITLEKLHTLARLYNFKCSKEVIKRIPHIKYLVLSYAEVEESSFVDYYLNNLGCLQELELLYIHIDMQGQYECVPRMITFPHSLKKLCLGGTTLHWDDVSTKIGSLPLLQVLDLSQDSCIGAQWETTEGQFCSLEILKIRRCVDLECWITETTHFPRLEHLYLEGLHKLYEIPLSIGDIPTLQSIQVNDCSDNACESAERIKEEQEELGNEDLQVQVRRQKKKKKNP